MKKINTSKSAKSSNSLGELSQTSSAALADNDIIEMTINNDVDMDDEIPSKRTKKPSAQVILSDETDTEDDVWEIYPFHTPLLVVDLYNFF